MCVRHRNVISLRCVIACEVLVAAMSQKSFIIKIKCFFLLGALLSPIHCVLLLQCYVFVFFVSF